MELICKNQESGRDLFFHEMESLQEFPKALKLPGQYFGLFLCCDATDIPDHIVKNIAGSAIKQGMVYFCSWGTDCKRVHDLFDSVIVGIDPNETAENVRMTAWLDKKKIRAALWDFMNVSFPALDYEHGCKAELVVAVGKSRFISRIRTPLDRYLKRAH